MTSADGPTAFVLAGGGSLGAVQVGMLKALADAGTPPDFVVGAPGPFGAAGRDGSRDPQAPRNDPLRLTGVDL